ncbi:TITAN-like protein isoform X2 [Jatropha curcas]|uniref:TITAN-like protein isoform X2 n=1 Tax=Jatropha curcas TaxID=180498 RepID=UPI0009D6F748|nr:TITAN-like protein isoform X2 [Jatropha curcas]
MKQKFNNANKIDNNKKCEFEFCNVCKLNHDQGQRHKYYPSHKKSLSVFLSRFQRKISDIQFFLKNPSVLGPEHASHNRFWCVVCDVDVGEIGSSFACANAIKHLSSADHVKNLKHFLWKYGGGMDCLDTFRILEADVAKWEKKCKLLENEAAASTGGSHTVQVGPSNDIRNELDDKNIINFKNNNFNPLKSNLSNGVVPLQYYTNENQISSRLSAVTEARSFAYDAVSSMPVDASSGASLWNSNDITVNCNGQQPLPCKNVISSFDLSDRRGYQCGGLVNGANSSQGSRDITQISTIPPEKSGQNVHSGAIPPWFDITEENQQNVQLKPISSSSLYHSNKPGKKLNPKRVGAAWAERRKIELEMEKRGEIVKSDSDANWLPNFGRVWQSGSRKESRKEFEKEKQKLPKIERHSEMPITVQPYVSKRMMNDGGDDRHVERSI